MINDSPVGDVGEVAVAVVAVERLVVVGEGGVVEVDESVVGVVSGGDAYAGGLAAALVEGVSGGRRRRLRRFRFPC